MINVPSSVIAAAEPEPACWHHSRSNTKARVGAWLVIAMQDRRDTLAS
jgi:hypothetical protein